MRETIVGRVIMISVIRSGMTAALSDLDVTSNNIANAGTTGFKRRDASFTDVYADTAAISVGGRVGSGVRTPEVRYNGSQGNLKQTGAVLDLAVEGQGMFALRDMNNQAEVLYTRDGAFMVDSDGEISTDEGYKVLSSNGNTIKVPRRAAAAVDNNGVEKLGDLPLTAVAIQPDGSVEATYGGTKVFVVAKVGLASFADATRLTAIGNNLFRQNLQSGVGLIGEAVTGGRGKIHSGALEMSNIDMTTELTKLIRAQQTFSGASRLLQSETEMVRKFL
jgi:flagellar hook protein FlgE